MVPGYQWNHGSGWFWLQASPYQGFSEVQGSLKGDANWNLKYCLNFVFCWKNGGKHGDDYLEFNEFRIFLATLRQYFEYFEAFKRYKLLLNIRNDQIKIEVKHFGANRNQKHWNRILHRLDASEDQKVSRDEFTSESVRNKLETVGLFYLKCLIICYGALYQQMNLCI